jgi:hypothetical protein
MTPLARDVQPLEPADNGPHGRKLSFLSRFGTNT